MNAIKGTSYLKATAQPGLMGSMYYAPLASGIIKPIVQPIGPLPVVPFKSVFEINPTSASMDSLAIEALTALSASLEWIRELKTKEDILRFTLNETLKSGWPGVKPINPIEVLEKDGKTGTIGQVTDKLNRAYLAPTTRLILSYPSIYAYMLFRIIKGMEITDAEGIRANIEPELQYVKKFINSQLASLYLEKNHLSINPQQKEKYEGSLKNQDFPYTPNEVEQVLSLEYERAIVANNLTEVINKFLDETIKLPDGVKKTEIANKMAQYLLKMNLNLDWKVERVKGVEEEEDDLEALPDVGPATRRILVKKGIKKFRDVKETDEKTLKAIWEEAGNKALDYRLIKNHATILADFLVRKPIVK
jgi:hypothetical protein